MTILIPIDHVWPDRNPESTGTGTVGPWGTGIDNTGVAGTAAETGQFLGGLPLPVNQYDAAPRNSTLAGNLEQANPQRRARFKPSYPILGVEWVFTVAEYNGFQDFWRYLGNGTAQFRIHLRYPYYSELTPWIVKFQGSYTAQPLDGMWGVKATLELFKKGYVNALSSVVGYQLLLVESDHTGGQSNLIRFRDGTILYVREP